MQRKLAPSLADILKEAVKDEPKETAAEEVKEDLNILPLPVEQIVDKTHMAWLWVPIQGVFITGRLFTQDEDQFKQGDWIVEMSIPGIDTEAYLLTEDAPKVVGQALISAWNYQQIWKEHAGMFLERQLMTKPQVEVEDEAEVLEILEDPDEVEIVDDYPKRPPVELNEYMKQYRTPPGVIEGDVETIRTTPSFDNG